MQESVPEDASHRRSLVAPEVRVEITRIKRNRHHAVGLALVRVLDAVEVVTQLADAVLVVRRFVDVIVQIVHESFGCDSFSSRGRYPNDTDGIGGGDFRSCDKGWCE